MAYDEKVAERVRKALSGRRDVAEKRMFGGIAFMVGGHMCCGVLGSTLMARVGPTGQEEALRAPHARPMDFTGRPLPGFVYVDPPGFRTAGTLKRWVGLCLDHVATLPGRATRGARGGARRSRGAPGRSTRAARG